MESGCPNTPRWPPDPKFWPTLLHYFRGLVILKHFFVLGHVIHSTLIFQVREAAVPTVVIVTVATVPVALAVSTYTNIKK